MEPSPNVFRTPLHRGILPDGDLTAKQRAIADAVRGCRSLSDFKAAPRVVETVITVARIPHGMTEDVALHQLLGGVRRARAQLDQIEAVLRAHGPDPFMPKDKPFRVGVDNPATRADVVKTALRQINRAGYVLTGVGDSVVTEDASASYVVT